MTPTPPVFAPNWMRIRLSILVCGSLVVVSCRDRPSGGSRNITPSNPSAEAGTVRNGSSSSVVPLHRHGVILRNGENLQTCAVDKTCSHFHLSSLYTSVLNDIHYDGLNLSNISQTTRAEYYMTSTDIGPWDVFEIRTGDPKLESDETLYLHSTNPAVLTVAHTYGGVSLFWRADQRTSFVVKYYNVYKKILSPNCSKETDCWIELGPIADTQYFDPTPPLDSRLGYKVKTVDAQDVEHEYSLPIWIDTSGVPSTFYFRSLSAVKTSSVRAKPTDKVFDREAGDQRTVIFNNSYKIQAEYFSASKSTKAWIHVYGHCPFTPSSTEPGADPEQGYLTCSEAFNHLATYSVPTKRRGDVHKISASLTLPMPMIDHLLSRFDPDLPSPQGPFVEPPTEELVFRIAVEVDGVSHHFPVDDGYFTFRVNNRVRDRQYGVYHVNIANPTWIETMVYLLQKSKARGFNAVWFDEWRPQKYVWEGRSFNGGMEAPSVEYGLPAIKNDPASDPWIPVLDEYAKQLKARVPGMKLIGNTIWNDDDRKDLMFRAAKELDGVVFENCLSQAADSETWIRDITYLERAAREHEAAYCLVWSTQEKRQQPQFRLFLLGSLLLLDEDVRGRVYLSPVPSDPSWKECSTYDGDDINVYPEYALDLGSPTEVRKQTYLNNTLWERAFTRGVVLVNASTVDSINYELKGPMKLVTIDGSSQVSDSFNCRACSVCTVDPQTGSKPNLDPGRLGYLPVSGTLPIAPRSAAILLNP